MLINGTARHHVQGHPAENTEEPKPAASAFGHAQLPNHSIYEVSMDTTQASSIEHRWLPIALALLAAILLFIVQQLYYGVGDARDDASGDATSLLKIVESLDRRDPQLRHKLFEPIVGRFDHVVAASFCDAHGCMAAGQREHSGCSPAWNWRITCVEARAGDSTVTLDYELAEMYRQTARDCAFFAAILAVSTALWLGLSRRLEARVFAAESRAALAAANDALTGLANRTAFRDQAGALLTRQSAQDPGSAEAVLMYIDIDGFAAMNDNHGHRAGDQVLQVAAERLRANCPPGALLGRLGGDEFGVLLPGSGRARVSSQDLQELVRSCSEPVAVNGQFLPLSFTVGCVGVAAHAADMHEALRQADVALCEAKRKGRGSVTFFSEAMDAAARIRYRLQQDLKEAIPAGQLYLEYQPQVDGCGELRGVEALVRWRHPHQGLIRPDQFIDIAEESGLIAALGIQVIRIACMDLVRARAAAAHLPYVSVNVSPKQLSDPSFVDGLMLALQSHGLGPRDMELEITESCLVASSGGEERAIRRLASLGFRIAIDDFGTGYSSLSRLNSMPVDKLKIDRSFVSALPGTAADCAVPEAILMLAQKLKLKTVAEGVETVEQGDWLRSAGCTLMQGYYFARPMPLPALLSWMAQRHSSESDSKQVWSETRPFAEA